MFLIKYFSKPSASITNVLYFLKFFTLVNEIFSTLTWSYLKSFHENNNS